MDDVLLSVGGGGGREGEKEYLSWNLLTLKISGSSLMKTLMDRSSQEKHNFTL